MALSSRVLQCVAVCCSVLQYVAVCCTVLHSVAVCCSVPQCAAMCLARAAHVFKFKLLVQVVYVFVIINWGGGPGVTVSTGDCNDCNWQSYSSSSYSSWVHAHIHSPRVSLSHTPLFYTYWGNRSVERTHTCLPWQNLQTYIPLTPNKTSVLLHGTLQILQIRKHLQKP